jgi:aminomethyltransferase
VVDSDGTVVGTVTSGNFSPMLDRGIALAFLRPDLEPGARLAIDIRGRHEPAEVVTTPFWTGDAG